MIRDKPLVSCKSRDSAMRYLLRTAGVSNTVV
jgi:hypothetical protein